MRFEEVETAQRETSDDQTGDAACGLYFPYGGEHGAGVWTFGPILRALPSSFLRKEPTLRTSLPALTIILNEVKNLGTSRI